uniref:Ion transport peptide-like protein n=1 Tax=Tetranychus urticae TaxID=32264 RepID=T1K6I2_TETUR
MSALKVKATIFIIISMFVIQTLSSSMNIHLHKRSFKDHCDGKFDLSLYARCDRVCEVCLEMYKDVHLHAECKSNCFNNSIFEKCAIAVLPESDANSLIQKVKDLFKAK